MKKASRVSHKLPITPHPEWAQRFWNDLIPFKDRVVKHCYFQELAAGKLSLERCRRALINFYPLVESFPSLMALNLAKTRPGIAPGHVEAKNWLIENIKVEQVHADWFCDWAKGFGCSQDQLYQALPSPQMDAINHYLWRINTYGTLAEGIGATNLAIEWATGEWARSVDGGLRSYGDQGLADVNERTMAWVQAHAAYDDQHPYEAMELIKLCAVTQEEQQQTLAATKRAFEYYLLALDFCYEPSPGVSAS
jgi:pyrroloquinoline quinone (PQQ) biosynthesis protein C